MTDDTRDNLIDSLNKSGIPELVRRQKEKILFESAKIYPPLAAPSSGDYDLAADELFPGRNDLWTTEERAILMRRAWEIMNERHKSFMGVH